MIALFWEPDLKDFGYLDKEPTFSDHVSYDPVQTLHQLSTGAQPRCLKLLMS